MGDSAYLEEKLAHHDPDFQLTSRFVAPAFRKHLAAIHAFRAELRGLLCNVSDPGVALAKLAWWQEEWVRFVAGEPRHPVTRTLALETLSPGNQGLPTGLIECLAELSQLLNGRCWETVDELLDSARLLAAPLAGLDCQAGANGDLDSMWSDIQLLGLVQDLPGCWRRGHAIVPLDLSARLQIDRTTLRNDAPLAARMVSELAGAVSDRLAPIGSSDRHTTIYHAVCRARLLGLMQARVGRRGIVAGPGPLRRLIIAWRTARRIRDSGNR
jgi:phytoene synthase